VKLIFSSSGLKAGPLPEGKDIYLDCRVLMDPTRAVAGAMHTVPGGESALTQNQIAVYSGNALDAMETLVFAGTATLPNRRKNGSSKPLDIMTIHCFCAWGVHRSVAAKHILAERFKAAGYQVEVQ